MMYEIYSNIIKKQVIYTITKINSYDCFTQIYDLSYNVFPYSSPPPEKDLEFYANYKKYYVFCSIKAISGKLTCQDVSSHTPYYQELILSFLDSDEINSVRINEKYTLILKSSFLNFWLSKKKFKCNDFYFEINKILSNHTCSNSKINFSLELNLLYHNLKSSQKITNETIFSFDKFTLQLFTGDPYKLSSAYCEIEEGKLFSFISDYEFNNTQNEKLQNVIIF